MHSEPGRTKVRVEEGRGWEGGKRGKELGAGRDEVAEQQHRGGGGGGGGGGGAGAGAGAGG
eukprot:2021694-Rhodomonas_salina.1